MKKRNLISTLLSLCLALAMCIALAVPGFAASQKNPLFAGGSGTKTDPYEIANVEQLLAINTDLGANYELVADIDFSGVSAWLPIGYYSIDIEAMMNGSEEVPEALAFHGTFDGNGHTMKNLKLAAPGLFGTGVFGFTSGNAYLHDVNIEDFVVTSALIAGSLVGWASGKTVIENVNVKNANNKGLSMVGALCGSSNGDVTVKNVKVNGGSAIGGGTYRSDEQAEPFAYQVSNCRVSNVTMKTGGRIIGSIAGYTGNNSSVKSCTATNVTLNGIKYKSQVGADPSVIPYTELNQFGGAL